MALDKLDELGYKPQKKPEVKREGSSEVETLLKQVEGNDAKKRILDLLVEALSESDPREILVYGMYVKKNLASVVPAMRREKIEKTLEWLSQAIDQFMKSGRK